MSAVNSAQYRTSIHLVERSTWRRIFTMHESRRSVQFVKERLESCFVDWSWGPKIGYSGSGCTTAAAWLTSGDHLRTGHGHAPDSYLILSLKIEKGFRAGRGAVSFTFQLDCEGDCQFVFMQVTKSKKESFTFWHLIANRLAHTEFAGHGHFGDSDVERSSPKATLHLFDPAKRVVYLQLGIPEASLVSRWNDTIQRCGRAAAETLRHG